MLPNDSKLPHLSVLADYITVHSQLIKMKEIFSVSYKNVYSKVIVPPTNVCYEVSSNYSNVVCHYYTLSIIADLLIMRDNLALYSTYMPQ